jgi:hypothetical protein
MLLNSHFFFLYFLFFLGTIHILRVDAGKFAKIWIGNQAQLLTSRPDPYVFHSPVFRFSPADVCSQLDSYIQHGTTHILRIPSGSLCKVWQVRKEKKIF